MKPVGEKPIDRESWAQVGEYLRKTLDQDELTHCMRCGFCLPACPTYRETGLEQASPRGRLALMKAVADGMMEPDKAFADQMNLCLGCRACETACPAGVQYGRVLEQARAGIALREPSSRIVRGLRKLFFEHLFPYQHRLRTLGWWLALYQRWGVGWLVQRSGLMRLFPEHIREMEAVMPLASSKGVREQLGEIIRPEGTPKGRVGLFRGCIMDVLFTETNCNTARLLVKAGYEVVIPDKQRCCGALHAHAGEVETAKRLACDNIGAFREAKVDWIVSNAGGCGAMLVEYAHHFQGDVRMEEDARWFSERVRDISQLVADVIDDLPLKRLQRRVTYQDSCHLRNGMHVTQPRNILRRIPGITYVELFESDRCCGSAGIYNLTQPEMSKQILDEKMTHVKNTEADILVTSNPGCLLQMKWGIRRAGLEQRMHAVHLVDLLMEAVE
ncbi:putative glycolate oxidase iron-sulfur subunit [Polycladomyces abyssicola]|uniref:Glycolate oxidase iron-sulfur subunit n=1 Tax=Polycladomyces abyssicola TaxID=1125966 RepID=A0A8D5ZQI5_9BACL|nr:(Fe-S)-binding protein [Polycladomyces abyssicola]BCU83358.1 putative glycolate oxidase iron-sulfur subunit [Polycladomyces abyssicola]